MSDAIPEIQRILYATDLSEEAGHAFGYAVLLAYRLNAKIIVLHVIEEPSAFAWSLVEDAVGKEKLNAFRKDKARHAADVIQERLRRFCEDAQERYLDCPFVVEQIMVKTGHPVDQILHAADEAGVGMIVMGSRGHGVLADVTMGSTSRRVLQRSKKPVLIVRLPESGE